VVGILIGTGVGILLLAVAFVILGALSDLNLDCLMIFMVLLSILAPVAGSIVGVWYGVYG